MKKLIIIATILVYIKLNAQENAKPMVELKKIDLPTQKESKDSTNISIYDEGTNNPENTGSTKVVINGRVYYIKNDNNIKIEYIPKP
ncbi:MAG: hypothetical protein ACK4ON_04980 [Bacteroidia bacterium]